MNLNVPDTLRKRNSDSREKEIDRNIFTGAEIEREKSFPVVLWFFSVLVRKEKVSQWFVYCSTSVELLDDDCFVGASEYSTCESIDES